MSELAKCPECGGECFIQKCKGFADVKCYKAKCPYCVTASTRAQAIAHHNQLAGRCRWDKHAEGGYTYYTSDCKPGKDTAYPHKHTFCPECGKQIEEVSE